MGCGFESHSGYNTRFDLRKSANLVRTLERLRRTGPKILVTFLAEHVWTMQLTFNQWMGFDSHAGDVVNLKDGGVANELLVRRCLPGGYCSSSCYCIVRRIPGFLIDVT